MRETLGRRNLLKMIDISASDGRKVEVVNRLDLAVAFCFIVAARHCGLRSLPPPFLGVSSLNLAAPSPGAAVFLWEGRFSLGRSLAPC